MNFEYEHYLWGWRGGGGWGGGVVVVEVGEGSQNVQRTFSVTHFDRILSHPLHGLLFQLFQKNVKTTTNLETSEQSMS